MVREELKVALIVVGGAAVVSWIFNWETLFLLGIVITMALVAFVGCVFGLITLGEKVMTGFSREKAWSGVQPNTSRESALKLN